VDRKTLYRRVREMEQNAAATAASSGSLPN
jgi:hypothetical protein